MPGPVIPHPITSEDQISALILADEWRMKVLRAAAELDLPDWWIGAGFLRNFVWDTMEGYKPKEERDVDLVYFSQDDTAPETDWAYDERMKHDFPFADWEIRNQARMHYVNGFEPYTSTLDGISHWVETATCVAVKLQDGKLRYAFCHGTEDLFNLVARPTVLFTSPQLFPEFTKRIDQKRWRQKWPHLKIENR